jgi:uncharacterized protein YggE
MSYFPHDIISVSAKGQAPTNFVSATFKATVTTTSTTGPEAKALAQPRIDQIKNKIMLFAEKAMIETDRLATTFAVDINRRYDKVTGVNVFDGYRATYTISFKAMRVGEATALHDALTSIDGVEASTPVFNVEDGPEVQKVAFQDAYSKANEQFRDQCDVLGLTRGDYKLKSWSIEDNRGGGGKMLSLSEGPSIVEVEPGKAVLEVKVNFAFIPRT